MRQDVGHALAGERVNQVGADDGGGLVDGTAASGKQALIGIDDLGRNKSFEHFPHSAARGRRYHRRARRSAEAIP